MMHYSNWLIDVKNRASFRNEYKSPPNTDWIKRGNIADMQNNNPHLNEKASELAAAIHLLKKGKKSICSYISGPAADYSARVALFIRDRPYFVVSFNSNHVRTDVREAASFQFPPSGQSGGRRRAPLPGRRSANRIHANGARLAPSMRLQCPFDATVR